jgi:hypothetical protein
MARSLSLDLDGRAEALMAISKTAEKGDQSQGRMRKIKLVLLSVSLEYL